MVFNLFRSRISLTYSKENDTAIGQLLENQTQWKKWKGDTGQASTVKKTYGPVWTSDERSGDEDVPKIATIVHGRQQMPIWRPQEYARMSYDCSTDVKQEAALPHRARGARCAYSWFTWWKFSGENLLDNI